MTTKEVELATFLGFQGVPNLQIAEDVSGTFLPIDQEVTAKEKEKVRVQIEVEGQERFFCSDESNEEKLKQEYYSEDDRNPEPFEKCGKYVTSKQKVKTPSEEERQRQDCPTCSKVLANRSALACHMRSHEGNSESKAPLDLEHCNVCSKTYLTKQILKAHLLTHDEERKSSEELSCIVCQKSFCNKYILKYHMNSHNGKQDQMCYLCSTMFATKSTLKKHMLNIHNDPTASCSSCGLKCKPSSLNRHEKLCKLSDEEREARKVSLQSMWKIPFK